MSDPAADCQTHHPVAIERVSDASRLNAVLNHPGVRPWVSDVSEGPLDVTPVAQNPLNVVMMGEHGGVACLWVQPGIYECHTQVLPDHRGKWARDLAIACAHYMFTRTDAYEIVTRVPEKHTAARGLTRLHGFKFEFSRPDGCVFDGEMQRVDVYSYRIQDWVAVAPNLEERGAWLHKRMHEEADRLGIDEPTHEDDPNHNRYVGAAVDMAFGGQLIKAEALYNRWVSIARQARNGILQHVKLVSADPPTIRFDIGLMRFHSHGDIEVIREC